MEQQASASKYQLAAAWKQNINSNSSPRTLFNVRGPRAGSQICFLLTLFIEEGVARMVATVHTELVNDTIGKRRARAACPIYLSHWRTPMTREIMASHLREEMCMGKMRAKIVSAVTNQGFCVAQIEYVFWLSNRSVAASCDKHLAAT